MEANELRIGNQILKDGVLITVDGRTIFDVFFSDTTFDYQPIPLTEEWLLKLGFKVIYRYKETDNLCRMGIDNKSFCFDSSPSRLVYIYGLQYEIKYVHELQNLYYALTKTELIINGR